MLEFMKLGFAQIAFGGEDSGGGGGGSDNAPASSPRPTQRPDRPATAPAPRDDGPSDADRNRQALLESQMQQEQRGRATQEAAAVAADRQRQRQEAARRMEEQQEQEDRARAPARVTAPTPPAAVDEFSGLPPSMTDPTYVPPSSTSSMIGTGDPVLDALLPTSAQPSFTYAPPVAPMTNPLGQAPAPSTQDSFLDGALAATQYNILKRSEQLRDRYWLSSRGFCSKKHCERWLWRRRDRPALGSCSWNHDRQSCCWRSQPCDARCHARGRGAEC
jgi:hypothetical protein